MLDISLRDHLALKGPKPAEEDMARAGGVLYFCGYVYESEDTGLEKPIGYLLWLGKQGGERRLQLEAKARYEWADAMLKARDD